MELTNIYDTFLDGEAGVVATTLKQEYNINITDLKLELSFLPTYLEERDHDWKAYSCMVDDGNMDVQFFFIINEATKELVELDVLTLNTNKVS